MVSLKSAMVLKGAFVLLLVNLFIQLSKCVNTCYPMQDLRGKIIDCIDCRNCGSGLEPKIPCGTTIDKHTIIGGCRPCPNGTFSSKKDTKTCQKCASASCFPHQVIKGSCTAKYDTSKCVNECKIGYKMNANQTECATAPPNNLTTTSMSKGTGTHPTGNAPTTPSTTPLTTPSTNPPIPSSTSSPTTPSTNLPTKPSTFHSIKPSTKSLVTPSASNSPSTFTSNPLTTSSQTSVEMDPKTTPSMILTTNHITTDKLKESSYHTHYMSLSPGVIAVIVIVIFIVIIVITAVLVVCYLKPRDPTGFGASLQCTKPHAGGEEAVRFIEEENSKPPDAAESSNNSNPDTVNYAPHQQPDALIFANGTNIANNPVMNRQVAIDMPDMQSPTMPLAPPQQRQVLADSSPQPQTAVATGDHLVLTFDKMPFSHLKKTCETFDIGGGINTWEDVASWLHLGVSDVNRIRAMDPCSRTRAVIETWRTKAGNNVPKFERILRDNGMTHLADMIKAWIHSVSDSSH